MRLCMLIGKLYYDLSAEEERQRNTAALLAAVRSSVEEAAQRISASDLARSRALFAPVVAAGGDNNDPEREGSVDHDEANGSDGGTSATDYESSGAVSYVSMPGVSMSTSRAGGGGGPGGIDMDSLAALMNQLQESVMIHIDSQLAPVLASLERIDQRLATLESRVEGGNE